MILLPSFRPSREPRWSHRPINRETTLTAWENRQPGSRSYRPTQTGYKGTNSGSASTLSYLYYGLTRLRLRPTRCISWRGWCKWTPVEPAGTCPDYKSSKLDGSEDPWTTGARDEHTAIGGGSLA